MLQKLNNDKDFSNALDPEELKQVSIILPAEALIQSKQDGTRDMCLEDKNNQTTNNYNGDW